MAQALTVWIGAGNRWRKEASHGRFPDREHRQQGVYVASRKRRQTDMHAAALTDSVKSELESLTQDPFEAPTWPENQILGLIEVRPKSTFAAHSRLMDEEQDVDAHCNAGAHC